MLEFLFLWYDPHPFARPPLRRPGSAPCLHTPVPPVPSDGCSWTQSSFPDLFGYPPSSILPDPPRTECPCSLTSTPSDLGSSVPSICPGPFPPFLLLPRHPSPPGRLGFRSEPSGRSPETSVLLRGPSSCCSYRCPPSSGTRGTLSVQGVRVLAPVPVVDTLVSVSERWVAKEGFRLSRMG